MTEQEGAARVGEATGDRSSTAADLLVAEMDPIARSVAIMALLRSEEGCPWDREQTFDTIKRHTLEEVYEVFDAIERRSWPELKDELGDLLLQVLFYARMAEEAGYFGIRNVAMNLNEKLIRRHPHVFGEVEAADADAVVRKWEEIKREEKVAAGGEIKRLLADVPRSMPAMLEASKLGAKAAKVGFDWPDAQGLIDKMREETAELEVEMGGRAPGAKASAEVEEEMGDLLFTAMNLARHLHVDAESALRGANAKFRARFGSMEEEAGGAAGMAGRSADELDAMWRRAKAATTGEGQGS